MPVTTYIKTSQKCHACSESYPDGAEQCAKCGASLPTIRSFTANRKTIQLGKPIILKWQISGVKKVIISPDIGEVEPVGWADIYPKKNTTYTLKAFANGVSVEASVQVHLARPKITYFSAAENEINLRYPTILHWEVENAAEIHIDRGIGEVSNRSYMEAQLREPGTYTLTAINNSGRASRSIELSLPMPEINGFTADILTIRPGVPNVLKWEVENAEELILEPGIGDVSGKNRIEISPEKTSRYTLVAKNYTGVIKRNIELTLPPPKVLFFEASDELSTEGQAVELYWKVENAYKIEINQEIGEVTGLDKIRVKPKIAHTQFVLTATGHSGVIRKSINLSIFPIPLEENLLIPIPTNMNTDLELKNLDVDTAPPELEFDTSRMEDMEYIMRLDLPEAFMNLKKPSMRKELISLLHHFKKSIENRLKKTKNQES